MIERFENGTRENVNGVNIACLAGSWREMGRQYGQLFKNELTEIYFHQVFDRVKDEPERYKEMVRTAYLYFVDYPRKIKEFFIGMEETSGLTEEQLVIDNAIESVFPVNTIEEAGCSALCVWGDHAKDKLVYGRNYDYGEIFRAFNDLVAVTVYKPNDGSLYCATVGYVGEIYCVNGMNEKGLFVELNNASKSCPVADFRLLTSITQLFELLLDGESMDYAERFFRTLKCNYAYIIGVADEKEARAYEWNHEGMKKGVIINDSVLAATNHYTNPEWKYPVPTDENSWRSHTRLNNIKAQAERYKGKIDAELMKEIISVEMDDGGAFNELTVYQIVAVPEERTLWLKVVNGAPWTKIELNRYF